MRNEGVIDGEYRDEVGWGLGTEKGRETTVGCKKIVGKNNRNEFARAVYREIYGRT